MNTKADPYATKLQKRVDALLVAFIVIVIALVARTSAHGAPQPIFSGTIATVHQPFWSTLALFSSPHEPNLRALAQYQAGHDGARELAAAGLAGSLGDSESNSTPMMLVEENHKPSSAVATQPDEPAPRFRTSSAPSSLGPVTQISGIGSALSGQAAATSSLNGGNLIAGTDVRDSSTSVAGAVEAGPRYVGEEIKSAVEAGPRFAGEAGPASSLGQGTTAASSSSFSLHADSAPAASAFSNSSAFGSKSTGHSAPQAIHIQPDDTIAGTGWKGATGSPPNWSNSGNWDSTGPNTGGTGERNLFFGNGWVTAGRPSGGLTSNNDLTSWTGYRITFENIVSPGTFTLQGNAITLADFGGNDAKLENDSTVNQNINFGLTLGGSLTFAELNAVNGVLTFGGTVSAGGSVANVRLYGSSQTLNFNNTVSLSGKNIGIATNGTGNTVNVNGSFTADNFSVMNGGVLALNSGGTLNSTGIRLGADYVGSGNINNTLGATFALTKTDGGQTVAGIINTGTSASPGSNTSGALLVDSQNTSGTNTISGNIFLDSNLKIQQASGGTLSITNATLDLKAQTLSLVGSGGTINITGVIGNSTGAGQLVIGTNGTASTGGTVTLSNTNTYSGDTFVRNGTLAFTSAGSAANSALRLGSTSGTSVDAAINLTTLTGGTTISSVINPVATSGSGTLTVNSQNTSNSNTLSGHIGMDRNMTINQAAGGTLNLTSIHTAADTTNVLGTDIKGFTLTFGGAGNIVVGPSTGGLANIYNSTGSGSVVKTGTGTLTLTGDNTYTGTTTINGGGTLNLGGGTASGSISSSSALALGGATLSYTRTGTNTQTFNGTAINAGFSTVNNTVSTDTLTLGALTRSASGMVDFGTTTGNINTSTANSSGIIGVWAYRGTGTSLDYAVSNGAGVAMTSLGAATTLPAAGPGVSTTNYTLAGAQTQTANTVGNTLRYTGAANTLALGATSLGLSGLMNAGTGLLTITGTAANPGLVTTGELDIASNTQGIAISSVISGTGSLVYGGPSAGTLTLTGVNTYTSGTTINAGTVALTTSNAGFGTGTVAVGASGTVNITFSSNANIANVFTGTGTITLAGSTGTPTFSNASGLNGFTGTLNVNTTGAQKVVVNAAGEKIGSGATVNITSGGTLYLNTSTASNDGVTFNVVGSGNTENLGAIRIETNSVIGATSSVVLGGNTSLGSNSGTGTINAIISESTTSAVTKVGTGTLVLGGANSYTGATTIGTAGSAASGGTLTVSGASGSIAGSSGYTINGSGSQLNLDYSGGAGPATLSRLNDSSSATVTLNLGGELRFTNGTNATNTSETFSTLTLGTGAGIVSVNQGGTGGAVNTITSTGFARGANFATGLIRGTTIGAQNNTNRGELKLTSTAGLSQVGTTTSSSGVSTGLVKTLTIVPYLIGDTSASNTGNNFVTYDTTSGFRTLGASEQTTLTAGYTTAASHENVIAFNGTVTAASGIAVNSLLFNAAAALNSNGGSAPVLTVDSGAVAQVTNTAGSIGSGWSGLTLGNGEGVVTVTQNTLTINTPVSVTSSGGLTKAGAGTLVLTAANLYTGATTINQGTLTVGNGTTGSLASGSGAVTVTGNGTFGLNQASGATFANDVANAGAFNITNNGTQTLSGNITGAGGGNFSTIGSGKTLILSGTANTYSNGTSLSGTLQFNAGSTSGVSGASSANSAITMNSGATLQLRGDNNATFNTGTITMPSDLSSGSDTTSFNFDVGPASTGSNKTLTLGGTLTFSTGTSGNRGSDNMTLNLTGTTGYTLAITNALGASSNGQVGQNYFYNVASGLTLSVGGLNSGIGSNHTFQGAGNTIVGTMTRAANRFFTVVANQTGTVTFNNAANDGGSGSSFGTAFNSGTTVFNNVSAVNGVQINLGNQTAASTADANFLLGGSTGLNGGLSFGSTVRPFDTTSGLLTIGGQNTSGTNTFTAGMQLGNTTNTGKSVNLVAAAGGTVVFSGAIVKNGADTTAGVTINGAYTVNGATVNPSGTVRISNSGNTYAGATSVVAGTLDLVGSLAGGNVSTSGTGIVTEASSGQIKNGTSTTFTQGSSGTSTLAGANLYTGGTFITQGTLAITNAAALGAGSVTIGDATAGLNATLTENMGSTTVGNNIIVASGAGTRTLAGTNGGGSQVEFSGTVALNNDLIINEVGGAGGGSLNLSGAITDGGTHNITVDGGGAASPTGFVYLTNGGNSIGGNITIQNRGTLYTLNGALSSANAVTIDSTSQLDTFFDDLTIAGLNGAGSAVSGSTLTVGGTGSYSFSGVISGSALTKSGSGTQTLTGANTYSGTTTITAGTLQLGDGTSGNDGTISNSLSIVDNANLTYNRFGSTSYGGVISGSGTVTKLGAGTQTLTGANTYSGTTTITAGTLQLGNGTTGNDGTIANSLSIVDNANLTYNRFGSSSYGGVISGSGTVTKLGAGTQTLTGTNTYSGGTTISGGTLGLGNATDTLANSGAVNVGNGSGGTLDLLNHTDTIGALTLNKGTIQSTGGAGTLTTSGVTVTGTPNTISSGATVVGTIAQNTGSLLTVNGTAGADTLAAGATSLTGSGTVGAVTLSGGGNTISGASTLNTGGLTVNGTGNTLSGGTVVGNATLGSGASFTDNGALTGNLTVGNGTLDGTGSVSGTTSVTGGTVNGTGLTLTGLATFNSTGNILSGTETATAGVSVANSASLTQSGTLTGNVTQGTSSALTVNGTVTGSDSLGTSASLDGTGTVGGAISLTGSDTLSSSGTLTGSSTLGVSGAGNSISSGTVSIAGLTTINSGGGLSVSGGSILSGAGAVSVSGTLSGTGTVSKLVTVNSGGHLAPGNSVGTLTLASLTLSNGSILDYEFNTTPANDFTSVTTAGGLTLNGGGFNLYVENSVSTFSTNGAYNLIGYTGGFSGSLANLSVLNQVFGKSYTFGATGSDITLTIANAATAATAYWKGTVSNAWNGTSGVTSNFTTDLAGTNNLNSLVGSTTDVFFTSTGGSQVTSTLGQDFTINSLTFNNVATGSTNISGNTLTIASSSGITVDSGSGAHTISSNVALGAAQTWTNNSTNALTVSGVVSGGTNGLTKAGAGTVTLSGTAANTYTGLTTVSAGTLLLDKTGVNAIASNVGGGGNDKVTDILINGGTLKLNQSNQIVDSASINLISGTFDLNGKSETIYDFNNNGGSFKTGRGGSFVVTDPVWSTGSNDIYNNTTFGMLEVSGGTNIIHGDETSGFGAGTLTIGSGGLLFSGTGSPNITVDSDDTAAGSLILNGDVSFTGASGTASITNGNKRDINNNDLGSLGSLNGTLNLGAANRTFTVANGSAATDLSITAQVTNGSLTKAGAGTLALGTANTFAGTTTVNAGTLQADAASALGSTSAITVNATGTLLISNNVSTDHVSDTAPISGAGGTIAIATGVSEGVANTVVNGSLTGSSSVIGLGALTLTSNSTIDFSSLGNSTLLVFTSFTSNSNVLNINNWTNANFDGTLNSGLAADDRLVFNQDQSGNFAFFNFNGAGAGVNVTQIALDSGFFEVGTTLTPVPEPSTWVAGALALLAVGYTQRRRLRGRARVAAVLG